MIKSIYHTLALAVCYTTFASTIFGQFINTANFTNDTKKTTAIIYKYDSISKIYTPLKGAKAILINENKNIAFVDIQSSNSQGIMNISTELEGPYTVLFYYKNTDKNGDEYVPEIQYLAGHNRKIPFERQNVIHVCLLTHEQYFERYKADVKNSSDFRLRRAKERILSKIKMFLNTLDDWHLLYDEHIENSNTLSSLRKTWHEIHNYYEEIY